MLDRREHGHLLLRMIFKLSDEKVKVNILPWPSRREAVCEL